MNEKNTKKRISPMYGIMDNETKDFITRVDLNAEEVIQTWKNLNGRQCEKCSIMRFGWSKCILEEVFEDA